MTQYNTLNAKLYNSQLKKLKVQIKNNTEGNLKFSSYLVGDSNDENYFPHRFLLINTQVSRLQKAFAHNSSANIKLSKTQLHKIGRSGGYWGRLLGPLVKTGLPLIGNVFKPLATSVLIPLGITAAASTTDAAIHNKMLGSVTRPSDLAKQVSLISSNEKMNDIMKIIKSLK